MAENRRAGTGYQVARQVEKSHNRTLGIIGAKLVQQRHDQRAGLAREGLRLYTETGSLRDTFERLKVSHETVRAVLAEAKRDDKQKEVLNLSQGQGQSQDLFAKESGLFLGPESVRLGAE